MRQEDFNDMMRYPWERNKTKPEQLPKCPFCKKEYCGDGVHECVECEAKHRGDS